jgi:molybdopterin/thiamine biosynthesis adenylyltransferase
VSSFPGQSIVGCGAIGGHLALALSKLGAGSGSKGVLRLIDPDSIQAENIGRHLLGLDYLYEAKVEAVKRHLLDQFPTLNIDAQKRRVEASDCAGDLIIDATGEESVGETINFYRLSLPLRARPQALHTWIVGNGECVQAIWCDSKKHACLHCLRQGDDARTKRFDPLLTRPEVRIRGCDAFTPYAVAAPLMGTALAIDMIIAWLTNSLKPRFRTRAVEGANIRQIKNQDVEPLSGCLACSGRS